MSKYRDINLFVNASSSYVSTSSYFDNEQRIHAKVRESVLSLSLLAGIRYAPHLQGTRFVDRENFATRERNTLAIERNLRTEG